MSVRIGHVSDVGMKRKINEDSYVALIPPNTPSDVDAIVAVADGMGGHEAGEVASGIAVNVITTRFGDADAAVLRSTEGGFPELVRSVVEQANADIVSQSTGERTGMGTTLTLGLIAGSTLYLGHVGDSRAYLFHAGSLRALTNDHSLVGEEVRAGRMSPGEAAVHPRRNLVTRALGAEASVSVDTESVDMEPGDVVLVCSDGLHGVVSDEEIADVLRKGSDLQAATQSLVDLANAKGGPDNVTAVLAELSPAREGTQGPASSEEAEATVLAGDKRRSVRSRDRLIGFALVGFAAAVAVVLGGLWFAGVWPFG